jgi:serine/threonine-protein kinase
MSKDEPKAGHSLTEARVASQAAAAAPLPITSAGFGDLPQLFTLPSADPGEDVLGQLLDQRYRVTRKIGQGGMGAVYVATHVSLGVDVAVKVLHAGLATGDEHKRRFWREARAASSLDHPNIVRVLDFVSGPPTFLVMELLDGRNLADFIDDHADLPSLSDVRELCCQLLDGLEAAHAIGIVHRDLKPDNVFISRVARPGLGCVKLVDFGLAHVEVSSDPNTLTMTSHVAGTPSYMSPEQCRSLVVGPSTDLYAFGCILTELLQREPPFASSNQVDLMAKHLFAPPPALKRPTHAEPVPPLLERLRLDLLAKDADNRPQSARETKERLLIALDPARAAQLLPERSQPLHRSREERVPQWTDPAPPRDQATRAMVTQRLNVFSTPLSETQQLALQSLGFSLVEQGAEPGINLLSAASMDELLNKVAEKRASGPVLCVADPSAEQLRSLIAAGAADVASSKEGFDGLTKKLLRLARRHR